MDGQLTEEQQIVAQYADPRVPRNQSHASAYRFLLRPENADHWWCQHYELTKELCQVLLHQEHLQPRQIWQALSRQLGSCSDCISSYHNAQVELLSGQYEAASVRPLLTALWQLDKQRLLTWLTLQQQQRQDVAEPNPQLVLALFEVLGYAYFLDDRHLCTAVVQQLAELQWQVATDEGSRFPGFYKLLAHPDGAVKAQVLETVNRFGQFGLQDLVDSNMAVVLDTWLGILQQQLAPMVVLDDDLFSQSQLIPAADKQQWAPANVWFGLKVLLGLLEAECLPAVLGDYPNLLTLVLTQSCPLAPWARQQQQPGAAQQQHGGLAQEGSMEHKHALGCLLILLKFSRQELWQLLPGLPPTELVQQLQAICWRVTTDTGLLKLLVQVLQAVVTSLLPHMATADDVTALAALPGEGAADGDQHTVNAGEAKLAIGRCLRLLLVQLPGSSAVPLLIRALALQAGLDCCTAALQSPSCPGAATFSHLWGPVCADVLYVHPEQQTGQKAVWGAQLEAELKQHQAPGIVRLIPLMGQMDELRRKVVDAAAELTSLAIQVDAAVLQSVLDPSYNSTVSGKASLIPAALDVVELAMNSIANYVCSPSIWLALAGCGNSLVSATYAAVAAQLAPLTAAAVAKASSALLMPGTEQQLEQSLVLPNAETVDVNSGQHLLHALDYSGWLHGQLMKAAVRHLHACSVRSRFFILPRSQRPSSGNSRALRGSQPTINALYQQLADSHALPPDHTAGEAYTVAVSSCCKLLMLGGSGPAAAVTAGAELALLGSCGVGVGELNLALQQHLLAPGSMCAERVLEAMQDAAQDLQKHKLHQVVTGNPERVAAVLQFIQGSLASAVYHGLDGMVPLLAGCLPIAWQLVTSTISSFWQLLDSCSACSPSSDSRLGVGNAASTPARGDNGSHHVGPAVATVLCSLLEALPTAWQCYQALVEQRFEQRRLYMMSLDSQDVEADGLLTSPGSSQGRPLSGSQHSSHSDSRKRLQAELQREMKWLVYLLQIGKQLFGRSSHCSGCVSVAVGTDKVMSQWRVTLEAVAKMTTAPLSKAVNAAAADLMSAESPSLDTLWLAKLFPAAAPGNLASTGLGSWPSKLAAGSMPSPARGGLLPAAATQQAPANTVASAADANDIIVIDSDNEWAGEWLSEEELPSDHSSEQEQQRSSREQSLDRRQHDSDHNVILLDSDEEQQQQPDLAPRQQQQFWPWLKQQALEQQQQQQDQHQQADVKRGVSKLLHSSKTLNAAPSQKQQRHDQQPQEQQQTKHLSLFDVLGNSRAHRRSSQGASSSDVQFQALLDSLDKATFKPPAADTIKSTDRQQALGEPATIKQASAGYPGTLPEGRSALGHLLPPAAPKEGQNKQKPPSKRKQQAAKADGKQQQMVERQTKLGTAGSGLPADTLRPSSAADDGFKPKADGGGSSAGWDVGRSNHSSRPRQQQGPSLAGLSKADQLRADLLGKAPVNAGGDRSKAAAGRAEKAEQDRLMAFINQQISKHTGSRQQHVQGQQPAAAQSDAQAAKLQRQQRLQELQQQRERQRQSFLEQRERERQQREQLERERKEKQQAEQREREAKRAQLLQEQQQHAAAKQAAPAAPVTLISDGALFAQAAAAANSKLASTLQQKRHSVVTLSGGALTLSNTGNRYSSLLRPSRADAPGVRLLGGPRGREATVIGAKYYPPLKMDEMISELLSWGYLGAVGSRSRSNSTTADSNSTAPGAVLRRKLLEGGKVPLSFESRAHYCHVFKGLLLEELRAGLAASHEELVNSSGGGGGGSRRGGGGARGFKCMPLLIDSVQRQSSVHVIAARVDTSELQSWERDSPRSDDYILLTKIQLTSARQLTEHQLPRSHLSGLVLGASFEQPGVRLVTFKVATGSAGSDVMANYWQQLLVVRARLWLTVVTSLVPNFREFQALTAVQQSHPGHRLFSQVLSPKPPSTPPLNTPDTTQQSTAATTDTAAAASRSHSMAMSNISAGLRCALVSAYNPSQQAAVAACLDRRWPFVLIQGPPGTGKTSAIVGILSALLATKPSNAASASGGDGQGRSAAVCGAAARQQKPPSSRSKTAAAAAASAAPGSAASASGVLDPSAAQAALRIGVIPPVRVLVCAQSNAAIDELATRLANGGVWGEQGERRPPAMVRLGRSDATHASVLMFHVDSLADSHVAQQQQVQHHPQQPSRDSVQARIQELRDQLHRVEQQLAELAKRGKAAPPAAAGADAAAASHAHGQQQQQNGSKRTMQRSLVDEGAAAKKQRVLHGGAATEGPSLKASPPIAAASPKETGSDMDLSDGEVPTSVPSGRNQDSHRSSRQSGRSRGRSRSISTDSRQRSSRDNSRDRHRSGGTSSRDRRGSRSSSRERDRHKHSNRHSSRSRSRCRGRHKGRSRHRRRSSRSRSSNRDRGRHTHSTSQSPDRDQRDSRSDRGGSMSDSADQRQDEASKPDKRAMKRQEKNELPVAQVTASKAGSPVAEQLQQPTNAAVSESLLRDQQRALLAALRTAELEVQRRAAAGGGRELERAKRSARQAVIKLAEIVMCTLSAAGGDLLNCVPAGTEAPLFDVLVIDEAAQALEPATLIPMQMVKPGTGRVVLVGDPCQLPPTILSCAAEAALLAQSLFERFARAGWPVTLLREQYRMHPLISAFPSRFFYDGQLLDGNGINATSKGAQFHSKLAFRPFVMWDCRDGRERGAAAGAGGSLKNAAEAQLAATLVSGVLQSYRGDVGSIAVISPYKAQVFTLREEFRRALGGEAALAAANIEFGTVDGFQGREADIVVFSCVRAQPEAAAAASFAASLLQSPGRSTAASAVTHAPAAGAPRVGFLADVRRMNVGLTRGRRAVWVVCHADTLAASSAWRPLLQEARSRGVLLEARGPFNQLLVATDKQLRGSYWTPALPSSGGKGHAAVFVPGDNDMRGGSDGPTGAAVKRRQPISSGGAAAGGSSAGSGGGGSGTRKPTAGLSAAAAGADETGSLQSKGQLHQHGKAPPPPPPRQPAAPAEVPTPRPGQAGASMKSAADQQHQTTGPGASSSSLKEDTNATLHAALQQRLQKQQSKDKQQEPPQKVASGRTVGKLASKLSSQPTVAGRKGSAAATAAAGRKAGGQPVAAGAAANAPRQSPATGSGGSVGTSRLQSQQQRSAAGGAVGAGEAAPVGGNSEQEKLKVALIKKIQQQKTQKK